MKRRRNLRHVIMVGTLAGATAMATSTANANPFFAEDGPWSIIVESGGDFGSVSWESWIFDGETDTGPAFASHLFENASWFRIGDTGGERRLDTLTNTGGSNPATNQIEMSHGQAGTDPISVDTLFTLTGASNELSTVVKSITVTNISDSPIDIHWFEYTDLDLDQSSGNDAAELTETSAGAKDSITQSDQSIVQTRVTGGPNHYQITSFPNLLNDLDDPNPTTLPDTVETFPPADATFGFQWGVPALMPGQAVTMETTFDGQFVVPAPGTSPGNPILPDMIDENGDFVFEDVPSDTWIDPPTATGFVYEMTSDSLFTGIVAFPPFFTGPFEVLVEDVSLGVFDVFDSVSFADFDALLGDLLVDDLGVLSFTIDGITPPVDPEDPTAFPVLLSFSTPTASLTMTAIPEPGTIGLVAVVGVIGLNSSWSGRRRRRQ